MAKKMHGIQLPLERSSVSTDIRNYSFLIHGDKKIGKTTFLAQEAECLFFEFDPVQQALEIYQYPVKTWGQFLKGLRALEDGLESGELPYETVAIDGVDIMYDLCFRYVCKRIGIEHPQDEDDFGKSWRRIKEEFSSAVQRLLHLPGGVACRFIAHSAWRETRVKGKGSRSTKQRLVPVLSGQPEEVLVGLVDGWFAYTFDSTQRVLIVKGDERIGAGHRIDHAFRTPDDRFVCEIPMGSNAEEAYSNFLTAFNNEQQYVTLREFRVSKRKQKRKKGK